MPIYGRVKRAAGIFYVREALESYAPLYLSRQDTAFPRRAPRRAIAKLQTPIHPLNGIPEAQEETDDLDIEAHIIRGATVLIRGGVFTTRRVEEVAQEDADPAPAAGWGRISQILTTIYVRGTAQTGMFEVLNRTLDLKELQKRRMDVGGLYTV